MVTKRRNSWTYKKGKHPTKGYDVYFLYKNGKHIKDSKGNNEYTYSPASAKALLQVEKTGTDRFTIEKTKYRKVYVRDDKTSIIPLYRTKPKKKKLIFDEWK